ncbi:hypothetical protein [Microlunatus soli]|uniref:hypothetical protein n=1 Tax=Microlunatus soli TaxID=630515 RepID=UPI0012F79A55|nr:hypothetical protein [Microlunatus soli]
MRAHPTILRVRPSPLRLVLVVARCDGLAGKFCRSDHGGLPQHREGPGAAKSENGVRGRDGTDLLDLLDIYRSRYGDDRVTYAAIAALAAYNRFNRSAGLPTFELPDEEVIIMLVALGHLPEQFEVAASPRAPIEEALRSL